MSECIEDYVDLREFLEYVLPNTEIVLSGLDEVSLSGQSYIGVDQWKIAKAKYGSLKVLSVSAIAKNKVKIELAGCIND